MAAAGNLKKVSLELGGKSPNIVFKDADLETAYPGVCQRDLLQSRSVLLRRFPPLCRESVSSIKVVEGVADDAKKIKVGPGLDLSHPNGPAGL